MKEYEEIKVEEVRELPKLIICNKCGKSITLDGDEYDRKFQAYNFHNIITSFGYGSKFDTDTWEFDLCEECLVEFVRNFKHLPDGYNKDYVDKIYKK